MALRWLVCGTVACCAAGVEPAATDDCAHVATELVTVGDPHNPPEPSTGRGAVEYAFRIARTETTNDEYVRFLNAVARVDDPFGLYDPEMSRHFLGGIARESSPDGLSYSSRSGYGSLPVVFVSWFDAVRFVNWMHYGCPDTGSSALGTTEGNGASGAYDTRDFPDERRSSRSARTRNAGATYWLPTHDEWVKAGFFDSRLGAPRYWRFATGTTAPPRSMPPNAQTPSANYYDNAWAAPFPHLTPVGSYTASSSPYGTFDQGGNVLEWVEDLSPGSTNRVALGGSLFMYDFALAVSYEDGERPGQELSTLGFRVAAPLHPSPAVARLEHSRPLSETPAGRSESTLQSQSDYVRVGDPGNAPDPLYGFGHVGYEFEMARVEVTNQEYAGFLNDVAAEGDPHRLFAEAMQTGVVGGIDRVRHEGRFRYAPKPGWERRPVTYVSWYDLARLANYHHFGRPSVGRSEPGTTEGDETRGAYDTRNFPASHREPVRPESLPATRNRGALYWIPSEDEWYKAAYYDPTRPGARQYWDYPVRSCDPPGREPPPGGPRSANYLNAAGPPFFLVNVDDYPAATSYYGTLGQGGNVWEWLESWRQVDDRDCWRCDEDARGLRGGSFNYSAIGLQAMNTDPGNPSHELFVYGGRLARSLEVRGWQPRDESPAARLKRSARRMSRKLVLLAGLILGMAAGLLVGLAVARARRPRAGV